MTTHAHYVSELNNIFGTDWIIADSILSTHLLCIEYKIKSNYNTNINEIKIYYNNIINMKNTSSCSIISNDDNIILTIIKPPFNTNITDISIKYTIIATKMIQPIKYTIANNIRVIHPKYYQSTYLYENKYEKIIKSMDKCVNSYINQIKYLQSESVQNNDFINFLEKKINNIL